MANKQPEPGKEDAAKAAAPKPAEAGKAAGGGLSAWLPLLVSLVVMPILAYAMTTFVLLPKLKVAARATPEAAESESTPAAEAHGGAAEGGHGKEGGANKKKATVALSKLIVNVSGTMGTRYLATSITLVSNHPELTTLAEENRDQLLDLAINTLSSKNIADLEKPGARNQIRSELIANFNNALGKGIVQEIFFTEFAIQ